MLSGQNLENVNLIEESIQIIEDKLSKKENSHNECSCDCSNKNCC